MEIDPDIEALERYVASLKIQIEQQGHHIDGLAAHPEQAKSAQCLLNDQIERLRQLMIAIETSRPERPRRSSKSINAESNVIAFERKKA
jgi:hypothetical protein